MADQPEFHSKLANKQLLLHRLYGREELGRLPEYRIELLRAQNKARVYAKELLGTVASVRLPLPDGKRHRQINGIVTRFESGGMSGDFDIYRVELSPWLWHLTLGADCRIFQDKTVLQILQAVFDEYKSSTALSVKLTGRYHPRPYTVQYRETDFAFVSRLMEEEGIYYYFKHEGGEHTMVLCDSPDGHTDVSGGSNLTYARAKGRADDDRGVILEWRRSHALQPLTYAHTDFAAESPTTDLFASAMRDRGPYPAPNELEVFDYPGQHDDSTMGTDTGRKKAEGERLASLRTKNWESNHIVAAAITEHRALAVGNTFTLQDHSDEGGYLVTSSIFEMSCGGHEASNDRSWRYQCRFDAIPKTVAFQPDRRAVKPVIAGPQTALVVGPKGDEIHTDKHGRVKVLFHWDRVGKAKRDESCSCWVRVSQPWAGKGFGAIAIPRVGDEVVVDFLEGNPDRPLVTGRVYNNDNPPPYPLPAQATVSGVKTRSSKGGEATHANELRFDDKKGSEYVWFQAEKNYHHLVKNDAYVSVLNDLWSEAGRHAQHRVGRNLTYRIGKVARLEVGEDTHAKLGADLHLEVKGATHLKNIGKVVVKGSSSMAITSGGDIDISVGQGLTVGATAAVHLKGLGVVIDGGTQLCIKAGGSFITLGPEGVTIQGPVTKINSGGSAGSAKSAAAANPAAPLEPAEHAKNTDPLAP